MEFTFQTIIQNSFSSKNKRLPPLAQTKRNATHMRIENQCCKSCAWYRNGGNNNDMVAQRKFVLSQPTADCKYARSSSSFYVEWFVNCVIPAAHEHICDVLVIALDLLLVLEKFLFEANYDHCMSEFKITHLNVNQAFSHHGIRAASTNFHLNSLFNERSTNMCCACVRCYVKGRQPRRSTLYIYATRAQKRRCTFVDNYSYLYWL